MARRRHAAEVGVSIQRRRPSLPGHHHRRGGPWGTSVFWVTRDGDDPNTDEVNCREPVWDWTLEQPRRYPVLLDVVALQRCRRPVHHNVGEELPLYPAVQLAVGRQRRIALRTVPAGINRHAGLVRAHRWAWTNRGLVRLATAFPGTRHEGMIPEPRFD